MSPVVERLYIIGAGASVPYGLPTLKTLSWELCQSFEDTDRKVFLDAIYEAFGVSMRSPEESVDFEELLNRLDPTALFYLEHTGLDIAKSTRMRAAELALSGLRNYVREQCLAVADVQGPYDRLVRSLTPRSCIVSFNWDVLLECAFLRANRHFAYLPTKRSKGGIVLLKPHGSINWFALLDREMLVVDGEANFGVIGDDLSSYMLYLQDPLGPMDFGESSPAVRFSLSKVPAIVPPTAYKLLSVGGVPRDGWVESGHTRVMKEIWRNFKHAVDQAMEIVIIGYSLPGTDAASTTLLQKCNDQATSTCRKRVFLVEPNASVAERYSRLLGLNAQIVCSDFRDFNPQAIQLLPDEA